MKFPPRPEVLRELSKKEMYLQILKYLRRLVSANPSSDANELFRRSEKGIGGRRTL